MKSDKRNLRVLEIRDNKEYIFSVSIFREEVAKYIQNRKLEEKYTQVLFREELADAVGVSSEAVKQWYSGNNGPGDIGIVKNIADFLNIDYFHLLVEKGSKKMIKEIVTLNCSDTEKEVILKVYEKIVEEIYFEAGRFKNSEINLDDIDTFETECSSRYKDLYLLIDKNSLVISEETRNKLYDIVSEISAGRNGMENAIGRWDRVNPLHYYAREFHMEGGFHDESKEDEILEMLRTDIFGSIEPSYYAQIEGENICYEGFNKNTSKDDVKNKINKDISEAEIVLKPMEDTRTYGFDYDDLYRVEYMKTIVAVFKEEFPQYFN